MNDQDDQEETLELPITWNHLEEYNDNYGIDKWGKLNLLKQYFRGIEQREWDQWIWEFGIFS